MDNALQRIVSTLGLVGFLILLSVVVGRFFFWPNQHLYTVGLVYVPSRAYHEQLNTKFKELVAHDNRFKIIEFTAASADQMLLGSVCSSALDSQADIFVTTGQYCSQVLVQTASRRKSVKPIVFTGVTDPVTLGLLESIERPGGNATGLFTEVLAQVINPANLLLCAKPSVKNILLVYGVDEHNNHELACHIKEQCKKSKITVTLLPIDNVAETLSRVSGLLPGHDALMYLEADLVSAYAVGMGKLASQHGITMFASHPDGVANAALAYSVNSSHLARYAFDLVKRIAINGDSPSSLPAQLMDGNRDFIINTKLCAEQDLKDIDIKKVIHTINTDPDFEVVWGHVEVR